VITETSTGRKLGFVPPTPAQHAFRAANHFGDGFGVTPESKGFIIKDEVDLSDLFPDVLDQGSVGDCTANGGVEAMVACLKAYGLLPKSTPSPYFSRYYLYAKTRQDMGVALTEDSGASITDMVMALMKHGVCLEEEWPSADPDGWTKAPSPEADASASKRKATRSYALSTVPWKKACLSLGFVSVFGVALFKSFEDIGPDGYMPMPQPGEPSIGGHCMVRGGYRKRPDGKVDWAVINSWTARFARKGWVWMPQEYDEALLALDDWTIHQEMTP